MVAFYVGALLVTYAGFGLSAVVVAHVNRIDPQCCWRTWCLDLYGACSGGAGAGDPHRPAVAIPLPHPLFYAVFTTLPFFWHSGILLVPLTMLLSGTMVVRHPKLAR